MAQVGGSEVACPGLVLREVIVVVDGEARRHAVKQHINAICSKLGAVNRAEAVAIALRKRMLKT